MGTPSQLFFSQTQNYCQLLFRLDRQHLQNKSYVLILHPYCEGLSVNFACISRTSCLEIGLVDSNPESHCTHIRPTHKEKGYCVQIQNFQNVFFCTFKGSEQKNLFRLGGGSPHSFPSKRGNFLFEGH